MSQQDPVHRQYTLNVRHNSAWPIAFVAIVVTLAVTIVVAGLMFMNQDQTKTIGQFGFKGMSIIESVVDRIGPVQLNSVPSATSSSPTTQPVVVNADINVTLTPQATTQPTQSVTPALVPEKSTTRPTTQATEAPKVSSPTALTTSTPAMAVEVEKPVEVVPVPVVTPTTVPTTPATVPTSNSGPSTAWRETTPATTQSVQPAQVTTPSPVKSYVTLYRLKQTGKDNTIIGYVDDVPDEDVVTSNGGVRFKDQSAYGIPAVAKLAGSSYEGPLYRSRYSYSVGNDEFVTLRVVKLPNPLRVRRGDLFDRNVNGQQLTWIDTDSDPTTCKWACYPSNFVTVIGEN